jgi:hypothetical protein
VKSGHVLVDGSCPAASVVATVTIRTLEFAMGQPVTLHATVRNVSGSQCTVVGRGGEPTASMGPCSSLSLKVENSRGATVWPGAVYMCPLLQQLSFAAGAQFRTVGTWNQESVFGGHQVPAGHYRVIVGGKLSFSITIRPS